MGRTKLFAVLVAALLAAACGGAAGEGEADRVCVGPEEAAGAAELDARDAEQQALDATEGAPIRARMRHVVMRIAPDIRLEVRRIDGDVVPARAGAGSVLDDPRSYVVRVATAEMAMTTESFAAVANRYVFADPRSPIHDVKVEVAGDRVLFAARLHGVPFKQEAVVSATEDGDIRMRPVATRVAGLPTQRLLRALGVRTDEIVATDHMRAVRIAGDDMILDPERMLPYPRLQGRVVDVRLEPDRVVLVMEGDAPIAREPVPETPSAKNYAAYRGGAITVGKIHMRDVDMKILDADPDDPLVLDVLDFVDEYAFGVTRNEMDRGVTITLPDADEPRRPTASR
jgi:hypothetical protein